MLRFFICPALAAATIAATIATADAQQQPDDSVRPSTPTEVSLSPFLTFLPTGPAGPMTGLALTIASGPFALRAGAHVSLEERNDLSTTNAVTMRPWGADADALVYLERIAYGNLLSFTPYVFTGVGTSAVDSGAQRVNRRGWSYGTGLSLPLGRALGVYGEWRWRMSRFVMPNAVDAPSPTSEVRVGLAFHLGLGGEPPQGMPIFSSEEDGAALNGSSALNASAIRVLATADQYVGTRYRRGGTSPSSGFDASGFVRFVFAKFGVMLPRTSRDQARVGQRVRTDWHVIAPGDLVMFRDDGGINHVAIYAGHNRIIHCSETGGGVRYDDLSSERGQWFLDHLVAARRVTPDLRGVLLDLARGYTSDVGNNVDGPDHAPRASMRKRP